MTLAFKVALHPNTTNQPTYQKNLGYVLGKVMTDKVTTI